MISYLSNSSSAACLDTGYSQSDFLNYLHNPNQLFEIDLSHATLKEAISKMLEVKNRMSPNYGRQFVGLLHYINEMEKDFKCVIVPSQITDIFWSNFVPYLIHKGLALSTIKTYCSQLKTTIEWAGRHKAVISDTYDIIKTPSYAHQQVALTVDEVSHIAHFDINSIDRRTQCRRNMEKVRDMFVLSCNLGQRFSDMKRIDKSCFDRNVFTILQQKTGAKARVDIERMAMDRNTTYRLLEKYGYKAPSCTSTSVFDRYLKQLLQHIGCEFLDEVKQETKICGYVETRSIPRYKLIASHTARRTFITNNVLRGFTPLEIMRASGHASYSSFEKYLCYFND